MATAAKTVEVTVQQTWQDLAATGEFTIVELLDTLPWAKKGADWTAWRAYLCAAYGLPMTKAELAIYRACTGRQDAPTVQARETYLPTGRRARKSAIASLQAIWHGAKMDYSQFLAPGERAMIPVVAKNKEDAQAIRRFVGGILESKGMRWLVGGDPTLEVVPLSTGVDIVIRAATLMAGRSRAIPFAALDEAAFFRTDESANPDVEIVRGIRPGMATIPGSMLSVMSSPYAPRGLLHDAWRSHYGREGDLTLVWQAPTLVMHDTPQLRAEIEEAYRTDPVSADSEYGAKFRADLTPYISEEMVMACTVEGRKRLEPGRHNYFGFVDTSGGSQDAFALCISHYDHQTHKVVQDLLEEVSAPFSPDEVTAKYSATLKRYNCEKVTGDAYAGEWPRERFKVHGIQYVLSEMVRTEIYTEGLPFLTRRSIELLDSPRLRAQLVGLDRKTTRSGKDSIDHKPGSHDDLANCCMGAALLADRRGKLLDLPEEPVPVPKTTAEMKRQAREKQIRELEDDTEADMGSAAGRRNFWRNR